MSRSPKNFEEAIERVKDDVPAAADATKNTLGDLEQEFRKIWSSLQGLAPDVDAKGVKDGAERHLTQSPWISIGLVGVVAFVIGYLMAGKKSE